MRAERRAQLYVPVGLQVQQSAAQDAQGNLRIHPYNKQNRNSKRQYSLWGLWCNLR